LPFAEIDPENLVLACLHTIEIGRKSLLC